MSAQPDTGPKLRLTEALDFLREVTSHGTNECLVAIHPETGVIEACAFTRDAIDTVAAQFINRHGDWNLYWSVNPTKKPICKKPEKVDIAELRYIHVDVDRLTEEALRAVKGYGLPPTHTTCSGGGYQAFWRLKEPIRAPEPVEHHEADGRTKWKVDASKLEAANLRVLQDLDPEHPGTQNLDRIMRLPGTINHPNAKKKKGGRVSVEAYRIESHSDREYSFRDFPPPAASQAQPIANGGIGADRSKDLYARVGRDLRTGKADYEIIALHRNHPHARDQKDPGRAVQRCIDALRREVPLRDAPAASPEPHTRSIAFTREEMLLPVEPEKFALPGILTEAYSLIAGAASSFKTTFLICLLLWKATGFDLLGLEHDERSRGIEIGKALLMSYEDSDPRLGRKLRRIIQAAHAEIRDRSGEAPAKSFLDRIAANFRRLTHTGQVGKGLIVRDPAAGLIVPNWGMLNSLRDELSEWAPEGVTIGLDPLRLAIVGSQNDDDGADIAVHVLNHLASVVPNSALVAASHTTKSGAADGVADLTGAIYATSGSALYSQHARGNFRMGRLKPEEIEQLFPTEAVPPEAAAKSLVTKLLHGRNSYGEELDAAYFLMDAGHLRRVRPRPTVRNASDSIRRGLGPVVEAIDRLSTADPPVRPSRAALESDERLRRHVPKQKALRDLLELLLHNEYLKDSGETSNRRLEVTERARATIRSMTEEL